MPRMRDSHKMAAKGASHAARSKLAWRIAPVVMGWILARVWLRRIPLSLPPLPALSRGEGWGEGVSPRKWGGSDSRKVPLTRRALRVGLSPRAGRGEEGVLLRGAA